MTRSVHEIFAYNENSYSDSMPIHLGPVGFLFSQL